MNYWDTVRLGAIYKRRDSVRCPDLPLLSVYRELGVVLRQGRKDNFNRPGEDLNSYRVVKPGDLVLNKMKTWQGSLGISAYHGIVSPAYFVASPRSDQQNGRFMHYLLRSRPLVAEYGSRSKGIRPAQWDLPWEEFATIKVRLPSQSAQSKIAKFLDVETARIDALIAKKARMVELCDERRQAIIDLAIDTASVEYDIGPIAGLCSDILDCVNKTAPISDARTGFKMIRTSNVRDGKVDLSDVLHVEESVFRIWTRRGAPRVGDVFLTREAPVGEVGVLESDDCVFLGQRLMMYRPSVQSLPQYLAFALRSSRVQDQIKILAAGSLHEHLRVGDCSKLRVPLMPYPDQRRIVKQIVAAENSIVKMRDLVVRQICLLKERRQALITAAVTGEMEVPGVS